MAAGVALVQGVKYWAPAPLRLFASCSIGIVGYALFVQGVFRGFREVAFIMTAFKRQSASEAV